VVTRDNGVPVKLRGSTEHPFTLGSLCPKVNSYLDHVNHPDRLLYPLRRTGSKGAAQFERITWQEALDEIAARFHRVIDEYGAEAIWPYGGTGSVGLVQGVKHAGARLFNALGTSRHLATICSVSGNVALEYTTGSVPGFDPADLRHADVIILWGANPLVSSHHQWPFVEQARSRGATVVVIDPIRTRSAARADIHIAPKPGTDGALALGVMSALVERDALDHEFLAERTVGWEQFRDEVLPQWTPAATSAETGVSEAEISQLVDLIANREVCGIKSSMGLQRHAGGGQAVRVLSCIPALTGDYGRLGGGHCYSTGSAYRVNSAALARPDLRPGPTRSLAMTRLGDGLLVEDDPPVKALMMWAANPVISNPDAERIKKGLSRDDLFCVVVEHFMTDTARYADIVLPGTMQTEHLDLNDSFAHLFIHWNNPASAPRGEARSHTEIFRNIATHMGLSEPALFDSDEALIRAGLSGGPATDHIDIDELRTTGWARLDYPTPYLPFADSFPTPSGKFEFSSPRAEAAGLGMLPHYVAPAEANSGGFSLLAPADHRRLNSVFGHRQNEDPVLSMHSTDAARIGADADGSVIVGNDRGSFEAWLNISDDVQPGLVITTKGAWLHGRRSGVNSTTDERDSDIGQGAVYHDNRVWVRPTATVGPLPSKGDDRLRADPTLA